MKAIDLTLVKLGDEFTNARNNYFTTLSALTAELDKKY